MLTVGEARDKIASSLKVLNENTRLEEGKGETIEAQNSLGRILFEDIYSPLKLPPFSRSTVDGYAVKAEDTYGVSESFPGVFSLAGSVLMGESPCVEAGRDEVVEIATGGMLPKGTDAVVMLEETELLGEDSVLINKPVSPGENVIKAGDDVKKDEKVLGKGHLVRKQDLGALAALGITELKVFKSPKIGIISTGDEIVSPGEELSPGKIRDINTWALKGAVEESGAVPLVYGICPDDEKEVEKYLKYALKEAEAVILSGGSSVGEKDVTADVIDLLGNPGVIFHGVSLKPGKPTIYGMVEGKPVFGLSGNPVSALVTFDLFVKEAINMLQGKKWPAPEKKVRGKLTRNLSSRGGREDYVRVKLEENDRGELEVIPILGEAGLIFTLVEAQGLLKIEQNTEGIASGEEVEVILT